MRSETILGVDRAMNRQNTLLIRAVVSSDGTKRLVKKVSVGKIGVDANSLVRARDEWRGMDRNLCRRGPEWSVRLMS